MMKYFEWILEKCSNKNRDDEKIRDLVEECLQLQYDILVLLDDHKSPK